MNNLPTTPVESTLTASSANDYTQLHDDNAHPVSPKLSPTKKSRKSSSAQKRKRKTVVFATKSKYHWFFVFCISVPFLTIILLSAMIFDTQDDYKNSSEIWAMGWISVFLVVLYMAVIPRKVDVRSNGTVGIKTCLLTFFIDDIAGAFRGDDDATYIHQMMQPPILLGTSVNREDTIVIQRKHGKWDLAVTPEDVDGFFEALEGMLLKEESDGSIVVVGTPSMSKLV